VEPDARLPPALALGAGGRRRGRDRRRAVRGAARRAGPRGARAPRGLLFGGFTTVQFDPALMASQGIVVEPREGARPSREGLRFKIVDGRTTLTFPPLGLVQSVGTMALVKGASNVSLTFFTARFGAAPALSSRVGIDSGWGPRSTLFRLRLREPNMLVRGQRFELTKVPIALTAAGAAAMNIQFGVGLAPFRAGQRVGTLNLRTRWYEPTGRARR
jgi:hypothetical protein